MEATGAEFCRAECRVSPAATLPVTDRLLRFFEDDINVRL
jgi:hypothetical protein